MFSFQPWHAAVEFRRYLRRFIHLFPGFTRIEGILRTRYNQYDSIIKPVKDWLDAEGVHLTLASQVLDVSFSSAGHRVTALQLREKNNDLDIPVSAEDRVYITLGSMTASSTTGCNNSAPSTVIEQDASWLLWQKLASRFPFFGRPEAFIGEPEKTTWESFTVTLAKPDFFSFMEKFTGNKTGTGGLVTFPESGWLMSIVMFHQPHYQQQDKTKFVFWGYGLRGDRKGDFIKKPLFECTGDEIIQELIGQLQLNSEQTGFFEDASVVSCRMPFITSQFMPRRAGDRPLVVPEGAENYALLGQYCELPRDTVFTVEYSVRTAMMAVNKLTGRGKTAPRVHRSDLDPLVLARAAKTLMSG